MKLTISKGKTTVAISKKEWDNIGKEQGWSPEKKLFAAETKEESLKKMANAQIQQVKMAIINASKETQIPLSKAKAFFTSIFNQLGELSISQINKAIEVAESEALSSQQNAQAPDASQVTQTPQQIQ